MCRERSGQLRTSYSEQRQVMVGPCSRISGLFMPVTAVLLAVLAHNGTAAVQSAEEPPSRPPLQRPSLLQPVFLNTTETHVRTPVGRPAYLHCVVQHPGDRTVSWVRKRDLHILTVGRYTYTNDERFLAMHVPGTQDWTLKVLSPTQEDSGVYECHVSTQPKISREFRLEVTVSRARILGSPELYVKTGSDVNLTCEVSHNSSVFYWYHDGKVLNYAGRRRLRLQTEANVSRLHITRMTAADTGRYTCGPAGAEPASVIVHAINGSHPAAMQHNSASQPADWHPLLLLLPPLLMQLLLPPAQREHPSD